METRSKSRSSSPAKERGSVKRAAPMNKNFKEDSMMEWVGWLNDTVCYNIPPGKPWLPMHFTININKGTMIIYLFALMYYFDNFSLGAWIYLALHGNYGLIWLLKDLTFPDPGFSRLATTGSILFPFPVVLVPYYFIGYWMMSGTENRNPSPERIFVAIQLYCLGVVFMVLTDAQKYLVLRERRGLITHCMTGWSRNLNYVGEMMLYSSFAVLCQRVEVWFIYSYVWGLIFLLRMLLKDYSLSKKPGWAEYKAKTWFYVPKLYNNAALSVFVYTLFFSASYYAYTHGGIEVTAKSLLSK